MGCERAIVRAETLVDGRAMSIEAELSVSGRSRTMVNRQAVRRRHDLHQALRTTVFSPEDIDVVRGTRRATAVPRRHPGGGRPRASRDAEEVDKILRQRTALLRGAGRRMDTETATTLDVWDARLDAAGTALVEAREALVAELAPATASHYARLAGRTTEVRLDYRRSWSGRLVDALVESRPRDLDAGMSLDRSPPGRSGAVGGGTAQPHPCLPGGAAFPGPGPAARRPPAGHRAPGLPPGAAPRRRVLRARPVPVERAAGRAPPRTGPVDHRAGGPRAWPRPRSTRWRRTDTSPPATGGTGSDRTRVR